MSSLYTSSVTSVMGLLGNGEGKIQIPNRPGYVYVRLGGEDSNIIEASIDDGIPLFNNGLYKIKQTIFRMPSLQGRSVIYEILNAFPPFEVPEMERPVADKPAEAHLSDKLVSGSDDSGFIEIERGRKRDL